MAKTSDQIGKEVFGHIKDLPKELQVTEVDSKDYYIKLDKLKDGYLYRIKARNSNIGIFNKATSDFTISRTKFGTNYLFEEIHCDASDVFGTVRPLKEICKAPYFKDPKVKLEYLNEKIAELGFKY